MTKFIDESVFQMDAEDALRACGEQGLIIAYAAQPSDIYEINYYRNGVPHITRISRGNVTAFLRQLAVDDSSFGIQEVVEIVLDVAPEVYATPGAIKAAEELGVDLTPLRSIYVNEHRRISVKDVRDFNNSTAG